MKLEQACSRQFFVFVSHCALRLDAQDQHQHEHGLTKSSGR